MSTAPQVVFRPVEGAVVDLLSLRAISLAPEQLIEAWLAVTWPGAMGLVLDGLEMEGEWAPSGPPGTRRPDARSEGVVISPGRAVLTGRNGEKYLVQVAEELRVRWPTQAGSAVRGVLVLAPKVEVESLGESVVAARETVEGILGFIRPEQADQPYLLPLASSIGNGRDWATDVRRLWQPEHEALLILLKRFEKLEQTVWRAEPEGAVWDKQVLGRNWVRYQTVACSALQAARLVLSSKTTTTIDRVRLLNCLFEQLHGSVERAANELIQLLGPPEGAGPYKSVGANVLGGE